MERTVTWAGIGFAFGVLLLAGFGAWWGIAHGGFTGRDAPTWQSAAKNALGFVVYYWWLFGGIGGIFGGATGLGSWIVRPRKSDVRDRPALFAPAEDPKASG